MGGGREDDGLLNGAARVAAVVGGHERVCLDPVAFGSYDDESKSRGEDNKEGETDDRLGHRHKHGGEHRCARVRVQP
jgi:hypothetical protein